MPVSSFSRCIYIETHIGLARFLARDIGVDRAGQWDHGLLFAKIFPHFVIDFEECALGRGLSPGIDWRGGNRSARTSCTAVERLFHFKAFYVNEIKKYMYNMNDNFELSVVDVLDNMHVHVARANL